MSHIRLLLSDKTVASLPAEGGETNGFRVTHTVDADAHTLTLTPLADGLSLEAVEYETDLPASLLTPADRVFFYDNNAYTNDVTSVRPYAGNENAGIFEMGLFKNLDSGETLLCGYLALRRFWSSMYLRTDKINFRFELEDRPLNAGETYELEPVMIAGGVNNENALLETYGRRIGEINHAVADKPLPTGWCSWSCYYTEVDEEKIRRAADGQAAFAADGRPNLIQIDDGWQTNGSFCGEWVVDGKKFPSGMAATADYVISKGMTFGLWLAPFLFNDQSEYYPALKHIAKEEVTLGEHFHPFDLGDPRFLEHLRKTFRRMVDEYHATYFKLDFLAAAIHDFTGKTVFVRFKDGFCVEVLRRALQVVRDTVGPDVFLLSCGAHTLIGAGILNGARMSCDIIWGKNTDFPSYWQIMKDCTKTVLRRYYLHRNVYINDPDGVVLRDVDNGDGFNCTYSEAALWAITVAMSGGATLSNDELENLSPARRALYTKLLPPTDIPGRPVDYFEQPEPTAFTVPVDENTALLALYHWGDTMTGGMTFDLDRIGMKGALAVRCLDGKVMGFTDELKTGIMVPHEAQMFLLRKPEKTPSFAFSDANIYGGINLYDSIFEDGRLTVRKRDPDTHKDAKVYAFFPAGFAPEGEVVLSTDACTVTRIR